MAIKGVGTTHDLANLLEDVAKVLRVLPSVELVDDELLDKMLRKDSDPGQSGKKPVSSEIEVTLATELSGLERQDAEKELRSLTVAGIRRVAELMGIRIPSKSPKNDSVNLLLAQVFDAPAGQELLRTFHKRNSVTENPTSQISESKPNQRLGGMKR